MSPPSRFPFSLLPLLSGFRQFLFFLCFLFPPSVFSSAPRLSFSCLLPLNFSRARPHFHSLSCRYPTVPLFPSFAFSVSVFTSRFPRFSLSLPLSAALPVSVFLLHSFSFIASRFPLSPHPPPFPPLLLPRFRRLLPLNFSRPRFRRAPASKGEPVKKSISFRGR